MIFHSHRLKLKIIITHTESNFFEKKIHVELHVNLFENLSKKGTFMGKRKIIKIGSRECRWSEKTNKHQINWKSLPNHLDLQIW